MAGFYKRTHIYIRIHIHALSTPEAQAAKAKLGNGLEREREREREKRKEKRKKKRWRSLGLLLSLRFGLRQWNGWKAKCYSKSVNTYMYVCCFQSGFGSPSQHGSLSNCLVLYGRACALGQAWLYVSERAAPIRRQVCGYCDSLQQTDGSLCFYIGLHTCICTHLYIYINREREREREREGDVMTARAWARMRIAANRHRDLALAACFRLLSC